MSVSRFQTTRLAGLLLLALLLRSWHPERMAVEHFDEGVYASGQFAPELNFTYPDQHLYAPPLYPNVLKWTLRFTGQWPQAVMWINVLLGTLLVAAVWWTTRELCGQAASSSGPSVRAEQLGHGRKKSKRQPQYLTPGYSPISGAPLAAAALVACSETFIQYSRAALTDTLVCLWMTLAVGAGARGLVNGRWLWLGLAGLLTALAWWTKYNGWLPAAIFVSGCAGWWVFDRLAGRPASVVKGRSSDELSIGLVLGRCVIVVVLAVVLWLPYLNSLQPLGGYAAVARNHAGYLLGWSGWWNSCLRHLAIDRFNSKSVTLVGLLLAVQFSGTIFTWNGTRWQRTHLSRLVEYLAFVVAVCALPLAFFGGLFLALTGGLIAWLVFGALDWTKRDAATNLRFTLLLAWFIGLALTTPLYHPYPRLILPWMISACIAAAWGWSWFFQWLTEKFLSMEYGSLPTALGTVETPDTPFRDSQRIAGVRPILLLICLLVFIPKPRLWPERREMKVAAGQIVEKIEADLRARGKPIGTQADCGIYVLAEPGLFFHLAALPQPGLTYLAAPAAGLGILQPKPGSGTAAMYVVTGMHSRKEAAELATKSSPIRKVADIPCEASDLVLLDEYPPSALINVRNQPLELWAIQ